MTIPILGQGKQTRVVGDGLVVVVGRADQPEPEARVPLRDERGYAIVEPLVVSALVAGLAVFSVTAIVRVLVNVVVTYLEQFSVYLSSPPQP